MFLAIAATVATGCAFDAASVGEGEQSERIGEQEQPLADLVLCPTCIQPPLDFLSDSYCDPKKYESCSLQADGPNADLKIKIYQCPVVGPHDYYLRTSCEVEPGWTVIGGGGQILDAAADKVVLDGSFPDAGLWAPDHVREKWVAEHDMKGERLWRVGSSVVVGGTPRPHRLKAFAIGIKLKGYDNVKHFAPVRVIWSDAYRAYWTTPPAVEETRPKAAVKVRAGDILLGGGYIVHEAPVSVPGPGMAIVYAYAQGMLDGTWHTAASNLGSGALGHVQAVAISIDSCPDRWSTCISSRKKTSDTSSNGTGTRAAFAQSPGDGYLLTGMGFWSSNWNRPLATLFPVPQQMWTNAGVKASTTGDASGEVIGYALHIRR
jgi:hypothetical protein